MYTVDRPPESTRVVFEFKWPRSDGRLVHRIGCQVPADDTRQPMTGYLRPTGRETRAGDYAESCQIATGTCCLVDARGPLIVVPTLLKLAMIANSKC
jgi:hypothetical protein